MELINEREIDRERLNFGINQIKRYRGHNYSMFTDVHVWCNTITYKYHLLILKIKLKYLILFLFLLID